METQIFYWTGVVVWWGMCLTVMLSIVVSVFVAPFVTYHKVIKYLWQWKLTAEIAHTGFSEEDIKFAIKGDANLPAGCKLEEILSWVERVKVRGKIVGKM